MATATATRMAKTLHKTTTLQVHHTVSYISLLSLHDYDVTMLNFTSYGGYTTSLRAPEVKKFVPSGCYEVT